MLRITATERLTGGGNVRIELRTFDTDRITTAMLGQMASVVRSISNEVNYGASPF